MFNGSQLVMLSETRKLPTVAVPDLVRRVWECPGFRSALQALTAVTKRVAVLWYETPCCLVETDRHLG